MASASYLVTKTEQELRTINAAILNVRKWLRKQHKALKSQTEPCGCKVTESGTTLKKFVTEARRFQDLVEILLDKGQWFLLEHANVVLEQDLENLVFLWNAYVEGLRKLHTHSTVCEKRDSTALSVKAPESAFVTASPYHRTEDILINSLFCSDQQERKFFVQGDSAGLKNINSVCDLRSEISDISCDLGSEVNDASCYLRSEVSDLSCDLEGGNSNSCLCSDSDSLENSEDLLHLAATEERGDSVSTESLELHSNASSLSKLWSSVEDGSFTAHSCEDNPGDDEISVCSVDSISSSSLLFLSSCSEKMEMDKPLNAAGKNVEDVSTQQVSGAVRKISSEPLASHIDSELAGDADNDSRFDVGSLITFDIPGLKATEAVTPDLPPGAKRRRMLLDTPVSNSNLSSRSESPLSLESSRSETPTGTLTRAERQNDLWRAIGSIDAFLMDKDILEACKSTASDLYCEDDDFVGAPNVSFAEFLQQYKELMDWLNQVHKVTQREVTSLSEKYLNQSYHEEMLERSPRREFINNYSHQLLLRYPNMAEEISARMNRLNVQWVAVEQAIAPKHGRHDADTMLRDLDCDLKTLRRWLNAVEARLLPLTIKAEWTDAELEHRLQEHQALQREIESHNKIVNAVLKLSERLEGDHRACGSLGERDSLQQVALNLERRWHGTWLQSLEWQCRLEEAISKRKVSTQKDFDFSGFLLPVLDESLFSNSSHDISDQGLIELDDDSLLFIGHRDDFTDSPGTSTDDELKSFDAAARVRPGSSVPEAHGLFRLSYVDSELQTSPDHDSLALSYRQDSSSGAETPTEFKSPARPSAFFKPDSPLGKRPFPDFTSGEASPAKKGSQSPSSSSGGLSPVVQKNVLESFINSRGLYIINKGGLPDSHDDNSGTGLKSQKSLLDRSSGDSANISESESKMGDSPPSDNRLADSPEDLTGYVVTSSDGEGDPPMIRSCSKTEVKDIGYSSESQSNDEVEVMHHQINMEYKFPGKCEVASDGPLGEKISLPSVAIRHDYYFMTLVDIDSTDKTDNGDTTDSGGEKVKKFQNHQEKFLTKNASDSEDFKNFVNGNYDDLQNHQDSESLEDSWEGSQFSSSLQGFEHQNHVHVKADQLCLEELYNGFTPMHEILEFSESDSAPESRQRKSIRYLIEHAEDLIKSPSPKHSCPPSPSKQHLTLTSPSKHTQTDTNSTVESSCDASGEDNSEYEGLHKQRSSAGEGLSTATDDADETLFNSMINLESAAAAPEPVKNQNLNHIFSSPASAQVYDSPRLRKQTGGNHQRRGKKDRPWSVVGLEDAGTNKKFDSFQKTAASESAIDHLNFHTDTDSQFHSLHFSTFPKDSHSSSFRRAFSSCDHTSAGKSAKRKLKYPQTGTPTTTSSTVTGLQHDDVKSSESSGTNSASVMTSSSNTKLPHGDSSPGASPRRSHRSRRSRRRSSKEKTGSCTSPPVSSATTDSYNSAEAESESETTDEYMTAPMEAPTSDADDVHNISGSLSEHSTWDNYQMIYPTASEDPAEELLTWDPQDDLEFDDDFILNKQTRSFVTDVMSTGTRHSKLKFTKHGVPCEDSDSDLEDFHHFLDQSELALKLADSSLKKKRRNPMGTDLHPNPVKYGEIIATYKTNISCLENICQHLQTKDVTEQDVNRICGLMERWKILFSMASQRQEQATFLNCVTDKFVGIRTLVKEAEDCLRFDRFTSAEELEETISLLKVKQAALEYQEQALKEMKKQLTEFSDHNTTICVDKYLQELTSLHKSSTATVSKMSDHMELLVNNQAVWLEYLDGQQELDVLLAADRERLHNLLCQQEYGMKVTKNDVLKELETLQSNLALYESKLATLQAMRAKLTKTSDQSAQKLLLASLADVRNQLFVMSERCRQIYRDAEDNDDVLLDQQPDFGKLAVSAAALHEVFRAPKTAKSKADALEENSETSSQTGSGITRSCASWLRSLPVQIVALMLVGGLVCALDPDILKCLTNFTLKISPELHYVNGPPAI